MLSLSRWAHFVRAIVFSAPVFASAADMKLTFWHSRLVADEVAALCESFSKQSKIGVAVNRISLPDFKSSLLRSATERELPDVALVPSDFLSMDKELQFSRIPPAMQSREIMTNAMQGGHYEGRVLGAPVTWGSHLMLYYNRDLIKKPARTFAEMEQQSRELKAKNVKTLAMNFGEMYWLVPFMGAFGGWPIDARSNVALKTPATVKALDFYFGLVKRGLTLKECRADCPQERFIKGEFAYAISGDWDFLSLSEKMGKRLGATTLPAVDKQSLTPMFSSYVLVFPNDSLNGPKRDALLKFMRYMQSPEVQRRWASEAGLLPVNARVFQEVKAKADENRRASLEQLHLARAMPNDRSMAFAWEGMAKGFSAMYRGLLNAEQAAALMQSHAEKVAKRAGE